MSSIFLNYYESVYTLESFLLEVNCKMSSTDEEALLKETLKQLATIVVAFDFKFKGPFKSYVDKRYSYEQILFLCHYKINESKGAVFENHMFRSSLKLSPAVLQAYLKYSPPELEKKLLAMENLSLGYFLNKSPSEDGVHWRRLHSLVGSSVFKYLLIYPCMFRHVRTSKNMYVQVSGCKLNTSYKGLVAKRLARDEKRIIEAQEKRKSEPKRPKLLKESDLNAKSSESTESCKKIETSVVRASEVKDENSDPKAIKTTTNTKLKYLMTEFEERDQQLQQEFEDKKSASCQLRQLGHQFLAKAKILYDRNLGSKMCPKFVYSDATLPADSKAAAKIIDQFILKDICFDQYPHDKADIDEMKRRLNEIIVKFIVKHRSCPFNPFLYYFCKTKSPKAPASEIQVQEKDAKNSASVAHLNPQQPQVVGQNKGVKRKRDQESPTKAESDQQPDPKPKPRRKKKKPAPTSKPTLKNYVEPKKVYAFLRRCLMHAFDYEKKLEKVDRSLPLFGGRKNFNMVTKHLRTVVNGLKYDTYSLNSLLHGVQMGPIFYLKPIKCDRFKRLVLLGIARWLFEDYAFMIIRAWFYVTDTGKTNSQLFYYQKSDWKEIVSQQLSDPATKNYSKLYNLEKITEQHVISYCSRYESNGMHLGRLFPKNVDNECRVISGSRVYNPCQKKLYNVNFRFVTLNNCLKWLIKTEPSLIGFSCIGHKEIYKKYSRFLNLNSLDRYINFETEEPKKKWNFIKFDLQKCFDSVDIKELAKYLSELFARYLGYEHVFTLMRMCSIRYEPDNKQLKAKYDHVTVRHHLHEKGFQNGVADYIKLLEQTVDLSRLRSPNKNSTDLILVPLSIHDRNINLRKIKESLTKCMNHIIIKIHSEIYERTNGILQGSVCSRNFCDLYLGRIERKLFCYENPAEQLGGQSGGLELPMKLNRANEIILRVVDDYLVICSDAERLMKIKTLLNTEVTLNEKKTVVHIWSKPVPARSHHQPRILLGTFHAPLVVDSDDSVMDYEVASDELISLSNFNWLSNCSFHFFSWCGFSFDVHSLDVYLNYEKYFVDYESLRNRLNYTNDWRFSFATFNLKFLRLFNSTSTYLFIETRINSLQSVIRNFVDFFALSAIRFSILSHAMPQQLTSNTKLQVKLILNLCYLAHNKLSFYIKQQLVAHFYSTLSLFKYLCFKVYVILFLHFKIPKHTRLIKLMNVHLKKLNFIRCIKHNEQVHLGQLIQLIEEQLEKFQNCQLKPSRKCQPEDKSSL